MKKVPYLQNTARARLFVFARIYDEIVVRSDAIDVSTTKKPKNSIFSRSTMEISMLQNKDKENALSILKRAE